MKQPKEKPRFYSKLWRYTWKAFDPYDDRYFTYIEAYVPEPTEEKPLPCVMVSVKTSSRRQLFRLADMEVLATIFSIPAERYTEGLTASARARQKADEIEDFERLKKGRRKIKTNAVLIDGETGQATYKSRVTSEL